MSFLSMQIFAYFLFWILLNSVLCPHFPTGDVFSGCVSLLALFPLVNAATVTSLPINPTLIDPALISHSSALPAHRASLLECRLIRQWFCLFYLMMSPQLLLSLPHSLLLFFNFQPTSIFALLTAPKLT